MQLEKHRSQAEMDISERDARAQAKVAEVTAQLSAEKKTSEQCQAEIAALRSQLLAVEMRLSESADSMHI